jgi:transposase
MRVAVDAEGWLLALVVTAASVSDQAGAKLLVIRLLNVVGTLRIIWADSGYDGAPVAAWIKKAAGITLEVVKRSDPHGLVRRQPVQRQRCGLHPPTIGYAARSPPSRTTRHQQIADGQRPFAISPRAVRAWAAIARTLGYRANAKCIA